MAFVPVVDTVRAYIEGRVDNQLTLNTLGFFASGGVSTIGMQALASALQGWIVGSFAPLLSNDWESVRVRVVDLTTETGPVVEVAAAEVGGTESEAAPNNVAACVSFRTDQRGRSARGRNFVPGVPNSILTLNTLSPTWINDLLGAYGQLQGAGDFLAGWQQVIISTQAGGVPRVAGLAIPVTSVTMVGNSVRSMRSREIGHGA